MINRGGNTAGRVGTHRNENGSAAQRPEAESVNESAACAIYSNGVSGVNARTLHSACTCVCAHAYDKREEGRTRPDDGEGRAWLRGGSGW